ncbi:hypothetical protein DSCO28_26470 [Desulfosarcina ovata subsp. sediminis]|uniref:DUF4136 domain-containing protein n=1 Tax=Desulfosarcina ovata subsp. sediminis TaxID=885957 RepID=A0A5K7ZM60_9BACT|nr:DUF4136 domain-containing protein [Desulfosarcina ovata]BBO82081.1 hypothetical protein DSCO28_26470 [Desulfosarcina ovata subsp. sediminis]
MKRGWFAIAVAVLTTLGCAGVQVSQDYDPATDFAPLSTFAWATPTQEKTGDPRIDNPLQDSRIRLAVERTLSGKGYRLVTLSKPTFRVRYQYVLRQRIDTAGGSGVSFGVGSFGRRGGIAIGTGTGNAVDTYDEASLVIDIIADGSDRMLWRGTGIHRYKAYDDPATATADIDRLVETILAQFPPETK